jgi:hypothetical protein
MQAHVMREGFILNLVLNWEYCDAFEEKPEVKVAGIL